MSAFTLWSLDGARPELIGTLPALTVARGCWGAVRDAVILSGRRVVDTKGDVGRAQVERVRAAARARGALATELPNAAPVAVPEAAPAEALAADLPSQGTETVAVREEADVDEAQTPEPRRRSPEPGARSPEPGARSPEPGARSPEPVAHDERPPPPAAEVPMIATPGRSTMRDLAARAAQLHAIEARHGADAQDASDDLRRRAVDYVGALLEERAELLAAVGRYRAAMDDHARAILAVRRARGDRALDAAINILVVAGRASAEALRALEDLHAGAVR